MSPRSPGSPAAAVTARHAMLLALALFASGCARTEPLSMPGPEREAAPLADEEIHAIAALLQLEDQRVFRPDLFETLVTDGTLEVRRRAAVAAGRIGDPAATGLLLRLLADDPAPAVRADAAFALGLLGRADPDVIEALSHALADGRATARDDEVQVVVEAIAALGRLGGVGAAAAVRDALRTLYPLTTELHRPIAAEALLAVWKFDDGAANVRAAAPYLDAGHPGLRWRAAYALMRGGEPAALPHLLAAGDDPEEHRVRAYTARALRAAAADSAGVAEAALRWLQTALSDPNPHVRINALRTLGGYGPRASVDQLAALTDDPDPAVAFAAIVALGDFGAAAAPAIAAVFRQDDRPVALRGAAVEQLARVQPDSTTLDAVRRWVVGDARQRYYAARAAGALPPGAGLDVARRLASDEEVVVAVAALATAGALGRRDEAGADERATARRVLLDAVAVTDPVRRAAAIAELRELARAHEMELPSGVADPPALAVRAEAAPDPAAAGEGHYLDLVRRYVAPALAGQPRPRARIQTPHGAITVELLADEAPLTVHNFLALARQGYFDAGVWHRVIPNFVLQDGAPGGHASGGPGWAIRDEINRVRYDRGAVGMALSGPDTGGSQWFITHSPQPHLDGGYTIFGRVVDGMEAADAVLQGDPILSLRVLP